MIDRIVLSIMASPLYYLIRHFVGQIEAKEIDYYSLKRLIIAYFGHSLIFLLHFCIWWARL